MSLNRQLSTIKIIDSALSNVGAGELLTDATPYVLGRVCPRCKHKNVIFRNYEKADTAILPVKGKFLYPGQSCSWPIECYGEKLQEFTIAESGNDDRKISSSAKQLNGAVLICLYQHFWIKPHRSA